MIRGVRLLLLALLVVLLGACDWTQLGFDASHAGFDPVEDALTTDTVGALHGVWTAGTAERPVVAGGKVFVHRFVPGGSDLTALDPATGAVRWHTPTSADDLSGPVVSGGTVYVEFWDFPASKGSLHAYDTTTGAPRWATPPGSPPACQTEPVVTTPPTVGAGVVVFATLDDAVCAFDASTGAFKWSVTVRSPVPGPAIVNGTVFVAGVTTTGTVVDALDAATGTVRWSRSVAGVFAFGTPVVSGGRLYVSGGRLSTFDAATGAPGWTGTADEVSVGGGHVVAVSPDAIRALDPATGAEQWSILGPARTTYSKPAIANGVVYVGSYQSVGDPRAGTGCCAHVSALRLDTGGLLFSFSTQGASDGRVPTTAIVSDGVVYVDASGVTALRP
jgi:outer membrane protein assembly factor BamB